MLPHAPLQLNQYQFIFCPVLCCAALATISHFRNYYSMLFVTNVEKMKLPRNIGYQGPDVHDNG
jgi:hypothetical protein